MSTRSRVAGLFSATALWLAVTLGVSAAQDVTASSIASAPASTIVPPAEVGLADAAPVLPTRSDSALATLPPRTASVRLLARPAILPVPRPGSLGPLAPERSLRPVLRDPWAAPDLRWDGHPRDMDWTLAAMAALRGPGARLAETVPRDIAEWCPGYEAADQGQRRAFWAGLISVLAWHESTHSPTAVGGGGQWFGLVQIAPGTARWRGCSATTAEALLDGPSNLRCGVRIMGITVPRDGVVSQGMRGVAADWGPFHSSRKREEMRTWLRAQDYCQMPPAEAMRPLMRPVRMAAAARPMRALARPDQRL
ncbi:transglycosylase SLT domain-containing protein [Roseibacterium sp. SDUM158016]|uniref:transglycosylase SLT domain-containing protein n=1 Tax=Roseicyclus sediminis TaxID=2980997 RepID=UPI0021D02223|nr:transglycosylase SLT domain-containing protein [Roseibacterium sp. SDUM158016]MCU4653837.1 transglycosylase SLT domain-containing protein [Roseibacterium sp. SDUM158016]